MTYTTGPIGGWVKHQGDREPLFFQKMLWFNEYLKELVFCECGARCFDETDGEEVWYRCPEYGSVYEVVE